MLLLLTAWCVVLLVCLGFSSLWARLTRDHDRHATIVERLLFGLCLVAGSSMACSVVMPLKSRAVQLFLIILGVVGIVSLIVECRRSKGLHLMSAALGFLALCVYAAWPLASATGCGAYDSLLYHFQQVQWLRGDGTPLGLGNLHSRLGMPTTFLSVAAFFEHGELARRSAWFMPALLPLLGMLWCVAAVRRAYCNHDQLTLAYCCVVSPVLLVKLSTLEPGLYFDDAAGILQLILVGECARLLNISCVDEGLIRNLKGRIIALAALSITIKLSSLVIAFFAVVYCVFVHRRARAPRAFVTVAGLLIAGYAVRSAMLTGWIFFPIPFGQLPVSWAMPAGTHYDPSIQPFVATTETVYGNIDVVSAWARLPGPGFTQAMIEGFSAWWPQWREQFIHSSYYQLVCIALIATILRLVLITKRGYVRDLAFILAFGVSPLAYWFYSAPDVRFASVNFWITTAVTSAVVLQHCNVPRGALIALMVLYVAVEQRNVIPRQGTPRWLKTGVAQPRPTKQTALSSGAIVYVPEGAGEDRCGHSRRPCTPYIKQNLHILKDGEKFVKFWLAD